MKTKFTCLIALIFMMLAVATGCQKSDMEVMSGSYTYKTSGIIGAVLTDSLGSKEPQDTLWLTQTAEQGQLNIASKDASSSTLILSWNDLAGNACSTQAHLEGRTVELVPNIKIVSLSKKMSVLDNVIVTYSGKGTRYDNMLIIPMQYSGVFEYESETMTIVASKIECIAKAN